MMSFSVLGACAFEFAESQLLAGNKHRLRALCVFTQKILLYLLFFQLTDMSVWAA
jgi:hypothetical protein